MHESGEKGGERILVAGNQLVAGRSRLCDRAEVMP
jgi:hypothetical protein